MPERGVNSDFGVWSIGCSRKAPERIHLLCGASIVKKNAIQFRNAGTALFEMLRKAKMTINDFVRVGSIQTVDWPHGSGTV
jgi:hypothetical protein